MQLIQHVVFTMLSTLVVVKGEPKCRTYNDKDVVCTAGADEYQLVRGLVSDNPTTTGLTLKACKINDVEYESFNNLTSLTYLDLSLNRIRRLKLGVLDEPKQITYLNLSYNLLTEFPLGLFDQTTKIDVLDLKGNKINKLELGVFDPLRDLKYLDLSSNALVGRDISPYLFDQSPHITFMDFSRNNMATAPEDLLHSFESLEFLNLDRCFLKEFPVFATKSNLKTMKSLIVSTNQISSLNDAAVFNNLDNLELLDLTGNIIETMNGDVLTPLKKLQKVVLRHNKIKIIPDNLFKNLPKLITIDLNNNEIEEVPVNAFRGAPLKNLNLSNNKITYLTDNFCLELKNSGGKLKKFLFDLNPWQCACLMDLLKEVKKFNIEYNSAKYNGREPVCVTTNEYNCKRHQSFNDIYVEMYSEIKSG